MLHDRSRAQDLVPQVYLSFWQWQSRYKNAWWRLHEGYREERSALTLRLLTLTHSLAIQRFPDLLYIPERRFAEMWTSHETFAKRKLNKRRCAYLSRRRWTGCQRHSGTCSSFAVQGLSVR